jgi:deferrochelatase/peroxidase EfeB
VILFARDVAERERVREHQRRAASRGRGTLDPEATPPLLYAHDHFGYRDRMSQPEFEGMDVEPTPGSGAPLKPGEFFLGYPDENGDTGPLPQPEILSRNGSFLAYRRMDEHVGAFREFLRANGETREEQELVAAKLMGRWRSGAPLVLAPHKDDPELAADPQRNNNFDYGKMDPHGHAVPLGSHIRRMNPRDTAVNMNRRHHPPRGHLRSVARKMADDGAARGIAALSAAPV